MKKEKFNYYKEFKHINRILDNDYNKLYDKYRDLELSHNRKYKLLERIETNLKILNHSPYMADFEKELIKDLLGRINEELTFVGRVRERWGK